MNIKSDKQIIEDMCEELVNSKKPHTCIDDPDVLCKACFPDLEQIQSVTNIIAKALLKGKETKNGKD